MKRALSLLLTAVLLIGCCCGCKPEPKTDGGTVRIRLNEVTHSVFYAPLYIAMSQGYFAEQGLEVELTNGGGADKVMTAVLTGQSDIGLAGPEAAIYVYNQGKSNYPKIFAQLTKRDGSFLFGRTNEDFSWENLRGKTIIGGRVGGVPEMTLEYVMKQHGVIPHVDAVVDTSVQFNMMAGAFTGGSGDYVTLFEPTATELQNAGKGYILASMGQESGEIPYTAFFASQSYLTNNADTIQKFTNAIAKAQEFVKTASPEDIAKAVASQFPDTDLSVLTTVAKRYQDSDVWNDTPVMKQESLERLETVMETAGELEKSEFVDFGKLVDNSFAQKSIQ